jgi:hypothetical protein
MIKYILGVLILVIGIGASNCKQNFSPEPLSRESEHFVFSSATDKTSVSEMNEGLELAETFYDRIEQIIGGHRMPSSKIKVLLKGPFIDQGPWFDSAGVHLYRYTPEEGGYWALFAHELGHAVKEDYYIEEEVWNWEYFGFYDEGFAEWIATQIDPGKQGFPCYGYSEAAVAGYLVSTDQHVPMEALRASHTGLNEPCKIQAYPTRSSWFRYIAETYSEIKLLEIVFSEEEPNNEFVASLLGEELPQVDADWRSWITAAYNTDPEAEMTANAWQTRTSWAHYCIEGNEF